MEEPCQPHSVVLGGGGGVSDGVAMVDVMVMRIMVVMVLLAIITMTLSCHPWLCLFLICLLGWFLASPVKPRPGDSRLEIFTFTGCIQSVSPGSRTALFIHLVL